MLGLDAASPSLLRAWAADGTMPTMARHMANGFVGDTQGVAGLEGATWPTFYTGVTAGGHGFYWLEQSVSGSYNARSLRPIHFARRKALWEVLSEAGRRVVVLDVPLSRRSPGLNGVQVVEWGTHDPVFGFQSTPARVRRLIRRTVGRYPAPRVCDVKGRSLPEYRAFADQLVRAAATRARLTRRLLHDEPWDFAIQVFTETHCAGHQLWHFHDPAHPAFDAEITRTTGNLLREVYAAVDAGIGAVLSDVGPETTVVLLTLHGMSYMTGATILLPEILTRLGVMQPLSGNASAPGSQSPSLRLRLSRALRAAYHLIPHRLRLPVYELRGRIYRHWLGRGEPVVLDFARTKCFPVQVGLGYASIRLNLAGREPQGTLLPGAEAERFCAELTGYLLELTEPGTGRRLVQRVLRTADHYHGACRSDLPDLIIEWDTGHPLGTAVAGNGAGAIVRARSPRIGSVEGVNTYCRTGDHRVNGLFVARGPGIPEGRLDRVASNLDLAPTFAAMLGSEMAGGEGQPIAELLGA